MTESRCDKMIELVIRFTPGMLFFQSYIYTYNFSQFDDVMDTRRPLLAGLAMLTFLFTAIAIYKCYSPCYRERQTTVYTYKEKAKPNVNPKTSDPYLQQKSQALHEDTMAYPQVVLGDYSPADNSGQYCEKCVHLNHEPTNQQRFDKQQTNQNISNKCFINKPTNHHREDIKTVVNVNNNYLSAEYMTASPLTANLGLGGTSELWQLSNVVVLLLDILVINVCLTYLWAFVKYYHFYYWSFITPVELFEAMLVPVIVICIEVTLSVARTLDTLFQVVDENRESGGQVDRVGDKTEKHLVILQM